MMTKILDKILKRNVEPVAAPSRITTETVAEHRERILAGGRRFKYPLQYARHKLVINAIIIGVATLLLVCLAGWWQLYKAQDTSEFIYRVTKVLPVPVANVDGQTVLYSDYLMAYRSSVYYSQQKEQLNAKTDDGKKKIEYFKQQSMAGSIADAYAAKLAKQMKIVLTDAELEGFIKEQRQSANGEISQQTYDASTLDFLGLSPSEYRRRISAVLLRQKVAYEMDDVARGASDSIVGSLAADPAADFRALATTVSTQTGVKASYGASGWVPKVNQDGGLSASAAKLAVSGISSPIKSSRGDGYYILRLLDINNTQVSYEYINVPLTTFATELDGLINGDKVKKYITV